MCAARYFCFFICFGWLARSFALLDIKAPWLRQFRPTLSFTRRVYSREMRNGESGREARGTHALTAPTRLPSPFLLLLTLPPARPSVRPLIHRLACLRARDVTQFANVCVFARVASCGTADSDLCDSRELVPRETKDAVVPATCFVNRA